jgi:regulator of replication initiation timing
MTNIIERTGSGVTLPEEVCEKIVSLEKQAKEIKRQQDSMKAEILDAMQKYGVLKLDNEFLKIALVPEHDAERFDSKTFKDEHPDVYDMYVKISKVKPSIRITVK